MAEERVNISVQNGQTMLEGLFEQGQRGRNAIVCHPHPLYGGDMHNGVVQTAQRAFAALGWTTLRFNFRAAAGEPAREEGDVIDLIEVCRFISSKSPGRIDLAGYSYGAWAAMEAVRSGLCPDSLILMSPPLDFLSFDGLKPPATPALITLGSRDEFCSESALAAWLSTTPHPNIALQIFPDVDHFYQGAQRELSEKIRAFLARLTQD